VSVDAANSAKKRFQQKKEFFVAYSMIRHFSSKTTARMATAGFKIPGKNCLFLGDFKKLIHFISRKFDVTRG
jgi:hypothetical protein